MLSCDTPHITNNVTRFKHEKAFPASQRFRRRTSFQNHHSQVLHSIRSLIFCVWSRYYQPTPRAWEAEPSITAPSETQCSTVRLCPGTSLMDMWPQAQPWLKHALDRPRWHRRKHRHLRLLLSDFEGTWRWLYVIFGHLTVTLDCCENCIVLFIHSTNCVHVHNEQPQTGNPERMM